MAQQTRPALHARIELRLPDNTSEVITPDHVRDVLHGLVDSALLPASDGTGQAGSGQQLSWSVIYLTKAEALARGNPTYATLDQIPTQSLCTGSMARVDLHPDKYGQELILVYDDRADARVGIRGFLDSDFRLKPLTYDGLQPLKWVKRGGVEEAVAGIRRYDPAYARWRKDETMKLDFGGVDAFFSAVAAGGPFPAPTAAGVATADWTPATSPKATDLTPIVAQHTQQLATLGVQGSPVYGYLGSGQVVGYATLDEALADPQLKTFLRFNVATVTVTKSNAPSSPNWAYYADGAGATLYLEEGVVLSIGGEDRSSLQMTNFFIYAAPSARNARVKLLASRNTTRPIGELPFISALCSVPLELSGGAVTLTGYYTVLLGTGTVYAVQPFQCGNVAAGITVVPIGGGGSGASYSKAESDTQLATKADLDPAGRVPRSQMPRLHDITYNYPAGQTASPEYRIVDFDAAGYYAISHISAGVTVNGYYLNDVLVAPTAAGQFLLATQDKFKINATAPAGAVGTIVFSQLT
jgi:hypothetical protein